MSIRLLAGAAVAASIALFTLPAAANAQPAFHGDCVRRAAPPSSVPHDVFRRILCVHRGHTDSSDMSASCHALAGRRTAKAMPSCPDTAHRGMM